MKIYDKDMYKAQEKINSTVLVIVVFLLGFFAGFMTSKLTVTDNSQNNINNETNVVYENTQNI